MPLFVKNDDIYHQIQTNFASAWTCFWIGSLRLGKRYWITGAWYTIGPPKGIEVRDFHRCLSIFLDLGWFFYKISFLYMNIELGWWGMSPGYILEYFCLRERPQRPYFDAQNVDFHFSRPHFWKIAQICRTLVFFKTVHVQKIRKCHFSEKNAGGPTQNVAGSF